MSLPTIITLATDSPQQSGMVALVLSQLGAEGLGKSTYLGDDHSPILRDMVQFYSSPAKPSGNSRGSHKCSVKFTKDYEVDERSGDGTVVKPSIVQVSFSLPIGMTEAQRLTPLRRICSLCFLPTSTPSAGFPSDCMKRLLGVGEV